MGQKFTQNRPFFLQLNKVSVQSQRLDLGNILLPVPVRDKGIPIVEALIVGAGILRALLTERNAAVLQGTAGFRAALVSGSSAASGAVAAQVHGA